MRSVIKLVGVCSVGDPVFVITQYCEHGNLLDFLRNRQGFDSLTIQSKTIIALDVAEGMKYLARHGVVHRDLAARNVLIGADFVAKVCVRRGCFETSLVHLTFSQMYFPPRFRTLKSRAC